MILSKSILLPLAVCLLGLVSCDSANTAVPDDFVGTYGDPEYGSVVISTNSDHTSSYVSSSGLLVDSTLLDGVLVSPAYLRFGLSTFTFDGTAESANFSFSATVEEAFTNSTGVINWTGVISATALPYKTVIITNKETNDKRALAKQQ